MLRTAKRSELIAHLQGRTQARVVERGSAWLEKNRRLWENCERKFDISLQLTCLAFLASRLRRL